MPRAKAKRKQPDRRKPLPKRLTLTREHLHRIEDLPGFARDHLRSADDLVTRIEGLAVALAQESEQDERWGTGNVFTKGKLYERKSD